MTTEIVRMHSDAFVSEWVPLSPHYSYGETYRDSSEKLLINFIGRMTMGNVYANVEDFKKDGSDTYMLPMPSHAGNALVKLFGWQAASQAKPFVSSHDFVFQVENGHGEGYMSYVPTPYLLQDMEPGTPYTLLNNEGNPVLSGYPTADSAAFLTAPTQELGIALVTMSTLYTSPLIARAAKVKQ